MHINNIDYLNNIDDLLMGICMTQSKNSRIWRKIRWALKSISLTSCVWSVTKSHLTLAILWTIARQAPLSLECSRQNTGAGCHFLLQGVFTTSGLKPCLLHWQAVCIQCVFIDNLLCFRQFYLVNKKLSSAFKDRTFATSGSGSS